MAVTALPGVAIAVALFHLSVRLVSASAAAQPRNYGWSRSAFPYQPGCYCGECVPCLPPRRFEYSRGSAGHDGGLGEDGPLVACAVARGLVARLFSTGGQLRWRILMVLVLLASIAVPLL